MFSAGIDSSAQQRNQIKRYHRFLGTGARMLDEAIDALVVPISALSAARSTSGMSSSKSMRSNKRINGVRRSC